MVALKTEWGSLRTILLSLPSIGIRTAVISCSPETRSRVNSGFLRKMAPRLDPELTTRLRRSMHTGWRALRVDTCREMGPAGRYIAALIPLDSRAWTSKHIHFLKTVFLKMESILIYGGEEFYK